MQQSVADIISNEENTALMLIDIGAFAFRDILSKFPKRAKNIGIFEPGTISLAAGLSLSGIVPIVYGISPYIVQRSLEQLKLGFVYQNLCGNFITTGASYDFSALGYSHYCPEDVATLRLLPGFEVLAPGTPEQFEALFNYCWNNKRPTYYRMTDFCNSFQVKVEFGKANVIRQGKDATVVVMSEMLDIVLESCAGLDVTILYYTTMIPFDRETLAKEFVGGKLFICHPFYEGTFAADVMATLQGEIHHLDEVAVPLEVLRTYGRKCDKDLDLGLDTDSIRNCLVNLLNKETIR